MSARRSRSLRPVARRGPSNNAASTQHALRLGWAIAETFGRLRSYQPEHANRRNDPNELPRFSYSNKDLSEAQELEVSYRRLVELAHVLNLPSLDIPALAEAAQVDPPLVLDAEAKKAIYLGLEAWSRSAWIQLNVRSAALGRAMTYGGSLADTFWYMARPGTPAFVAGRQSIDALLRVHRLQRMQERMNEINQAFSAEACDAIGHSLGEWMLDERKLAWATASDWQGLGVDVDAQPRRTPPQQLYFNLFRQVRTWRDLLFEARQPLDYVSPGYRRRANMIAGTITIALVILIGLLVGLIVFTLFNFALSFVDRTAIGQQAQNEIIEAISVLLSLGSTLAVVTAGLLSRASAAVYQFDAWLEQAMVRRTIRTQATVPWNDPPRRASE